MVLGVCLCVCVFGEIVFVMLKIMIIPLKYDTCKIYLDDPNLRLHLDHS